MLLALGACHLLLTSSTVAFFGVDHPLQDQFRLNFRYLTEPFLQAVLALENGHRPVFPGLVRWIELALLGGTQGLQRATSWGAAAFCLAVLVRQAWRDLGGQRALAAAATCALATLLAWNANARMFIHAYEAQHVWYVLAGLVAAVTIASRDGRSPGAWMAAILACAFSTFSFGPGIATFAALFVVAVLSRAGMRACTAIVVAAAAAFIAYTWLLPGSEGVRQQSTHVPIASAALFALARVGAVFAEIVRPWLPDDGVRLPIAWAAGALGCAGVAASVISRWRNGDRFSRTELHGIGLFAFGVTANVLVAVNRSTYFMDHTTQLFAERYLFWSCAAWAGIALYALSRSVGMAGWGKRAAMACVVLVSVIAMRSATGWYGWSAQVYRLVELGAIVNRLDLRLDSELRDITDGPVENAWRCARVMRESRTGQFATLDGHALGSRLERRDAPLQTASVRVRRLTDSRRPASHVAAVSAVLPPEIAEKHGRRHWLATSGGTIVGAGEFTFHSERKAGDLTLGASHRDGFEGYVAGDAAVVWLVADHDGRHETLAALAIPAR
jgi:hypothetical protein